MSMERGGLFPAYRWLTVILLTALLIFLLTSISMPASQLLGAMLAAIAVSVCGAGAQLPRPLFLLGQSVVGCVIAASMHRGTIDEFLRRWPLLLGMVAMVLAVAALLSWYAVKREILPGSTAAWGISPGAAPMMILLAERHGADFRLVAVMQYVRMVMVSVVAGMIAKIWSAPLPPSPRDGESAGWADLGGSLSIILAGFALAALLKKVSLAMVFPALAGAIFKLTGVFDIHVPQPLLLAANIAIGWSVGFRFDRGIVLHSLRLLPKLILLYAVMITLCGAGGIAIGRMAELDPLTSYLATSPGGVDSLAIVALSVGGNISMVMAVQMLRFFGS